MKYYPLNRVKTNQKTSGGEFLLNGQNYRGPYYETYTGEFFTGTDPVQGPSEILTKLPSLQNPYPGAKVAINSNLEYDTQLTSTQQAGLVSTFQIPQPYYPQPTDVDYQRGSIMRYFAKKRDRPGFIIEVNKSTHDSLKNTDSVYDYITYESVSTFWQITGPLHDDRTGKQYKVAGIIDTNKRLIDLKDPGFPGLIAFIGGDYTKFAKPTK